MAFKKICQSRYAKCRCFFVKLKNGIQIFSRFSFDLSRLCHSDSFISNPDIQNVCYCLQKL